MSAGGANVAGPFQLLRGKTKSLKKITAQVQTSEVFVKVNGTWKIRVDHASFVPPPQPPPPASK
jgi:ketosteroid isomerase-like protein